MEQDHPASLIPGAAYQMSACLSDLTTAGTARTGHTDPADYAGLAAAGTRNPSNVPGLQVDGYFPDGSTSNTEHGWNHDAQFVLRLPDRWNGGLVVTGAPGNRRQYSLDSTISDWVLAQGYAFAATDKGNTGAAFFADGRRPGDAIAEWNRRLTQLTVASKAATARYYGHRVRRTLVTGISNGGYLTRWQLENHPELYDGGVDWEGTLWRADANMFTYLPTALREYPRVAAGDPAAHDAMLAAGFAPGSDFLWPYHDQVYWDLTQRIYRAEFDPGFSPGDPAGSPFCASGSPHCDADYDYASRPAAVHRAVARIALTGRIGKPLISLQGTLDTLLPIRTDGDVYARMVRGAPFRYYRIAGGTHTDGLYDTYPDRLRPILPCYRAALAAMGAWLSGSATPPPGGTVPRGSDVVNSCSL
ncbi:tannase/feruloyl esterase family alpha/beta hydrolase [Actinocatenispora rupis]|nr:tannase/feruloyl esterase family alpha/beta hydrolase [Actinocatenispora rupis]